MKNTTQRRLALPISFVVAALVISAPAFAAPKTAQSVVTVVPATSIGKFKIGLKRTQAHRLYGEPATKLRSLPADYYDYTLQSGKKVSVTLWHYRGRISAVDIKEANFKVTNGLSSQSTLGSIKRLYNGSRLAIHKDQIFDGWFYTYDFIDRGIAFCFYVDYNKALTDSVKSYKVAVHKRGQKWTERISSE